jgi:methionine-rich copper-binding protein CopC
MRVILSAAAVTIVLSSSIPSALAHSMLVKAEPPRRAVLAKAPVQVRLWFNEEIEGDYASLVVLDAEKHPVTEVKPQLAQDDPKSIVLPLPELAPGKYSVKFRVLSVDGHVVESSFDFTVKGKVHGK